MAKNIRNVMVSNVPIPFLDSHGPAVKIKFMKKKEPKNCWEFWNCSKEIKKDCPAYQTDSGRECWLVALSFCPKRKTKYKYCWECPWFKKLNPDFYQT